MNKNCIIYQILLGIIPTFSENFIQIDKVWPRLQPKTRSEAILKIYTSLDHFIIDILQKCILEAAIDCQEIQCWLKGEIVPKWMSSLSIAASKIHFLRLSMLKWSKLVYILRMASDHVLGCSRGHTLSIWMKFSENVGMIPIKIWYLMQFVLTWTNLAQMAHFRRMKTFW